MNILNPVTALQFHQQYWENTPLHIERAQSDYFNDLLSVTQIETLLSTRNLYFPDVQLVNSASDVPVSTYTGDHNQIRVTELLRNYHAGATLVMSSAHRQFTGLSELCRAVTSVFTMRSQANVYLTPPGARGFKAHYDTHDVFILQVAGSKTFRIYESDTELPFTNDTFDPDSHTTGTLQENIELHAGDTLYIPRGVVHDAVANDGDQSLHVTLGVFPYVARDLMQEMVQLAAEQNTEFRRSVSPSFSAGSEGLRTTELSSLKGLLDQVATEENYQRAIARLADEVATGGNTSTSGGLSNTEVGMHSTVAIVPSAVVNVVKTEDQIRLRLIGQVLAFDLQFQQVLDMLINSDAVRVAELPAIGEVDGSANDQNQKIMLCNQLLWSGAIRVVD